MTFHGIPAVRVAALDFANQGKTRAELVEVVQSSVNVSVRQISQELRRLCITEDTEGRLRLPDNVRPLWRRIVAVTPSCPESAGGRRMSIVFRDGERVQIDTPLKQGDIVKVCVGEGVSSEWSWAECIVILPDGGWLGRIKNVLVSSADHGFDHGDHAMFAAQQTDDGHWWWQCVSGQPVSVEHSYGGAA